MSEIYKFFLLVGSLLTVFILKLYNPSYQDDNPIEEKVEQVIQYETGVDIDLTPFSPEE